MRPSRMRLSSRLGFDALLIAAAVALAVISLSYDPRAGRVPFIVALIAVALLAVQSWLDLRSAPANADSVASVEDPDGAIAWRWPAYTLLAVAGCVFLVWLVGYLIAVPVFAFASMVLLGRTGWKTALAVTAGLWAFVYVLLEILLRANLS